MIDDGWVGDYAKGLLEILSTQTPVSLHVLQETELRKLHKNLEQMEQITFLIGQSWNNNIS